MSRRFSQWLKVLALPMAVASLAACGGGGSDGTGPTAVLAESATAAATPGATPAPAAAPPAAAAAADTSSAPSSAGAPAAAAPKSIVEVAQGNATFSSLVAALQFASNDGDLVKLLAGPGSFTVFAPTNAAFDALARELTGRAGATAADLLVPANKALVRAVLQYHVLGAAVPKADVPVGQPIDPVLDGTDTFRIDVTGAKLLITDGRVRTSEIVTTDVAASNGVVHVIDKVILPAEATSTRTIVDIALGNANFSSLVAALEFASNDGDLVNLLSGPGSFTVFAPDNAAFDALARELTGNPGATAADLLVPANKALVRSALLYHALTTEVFAADIQLGRAVEPALGTGSFFKIVAVDGKPAIVDGRARSTNIVATDIDASNGVIHVLDRVILPADKSIVQIAASSPDFSSLVAALTFASNDGDLVKLLSDPGTFTVFAPTNAAFDALARELTQNASATAADLLVPANKALVRAVLQYHVLVARVLEAEVPVGQPIDPALAGNATFTIDVKSGKLVVTDARHREAGIVATDVFANNGVIHVLNRVILPPSH